MVYIRTLQSVGHSSLGISLAPTLKGSVDSPKGKREVSTVRTKSAHLTRAFLLPKASCN